MDNNDGHGWHCNCVDPCQHANQGTGWYYGKRRERVVSEVEVSYYVSADSPSDARAKLGLATSRKERAVLDTISYSITPESDWTEIAYDFNEGMGR